MFDFLERRGSGDKICGGSLSSGPAAWRLDRRLRDMTIAYAHAPVKRDCLICAGVRAIPVIYERAPRCPCATKYVAFGIASPLVISQWHPAGKSDDFVLTPEVSASPGTKLYVGSGDMLCFST